jgi:hypothetical protein
MGVKKIKISRPVSSVELAARQGSAGQRLAGSLPVPAMTGVAGTEVDHCPGRRR